jgi:hypothetical protein
MIPRDVLVYFPLRFSLQAGGQLSAHTQHNTTHNNNTSMITVCRRVNSQRGARPGSLGVFLS